LALVSDSGTPGISDPGGKLVNEVVKWLSDQVKIVPIPGPSALTCAASISGLPMERFLFLGFLPKKKKRKEILKEIINFDYPIIFYESPYRILKTLEELKEINKELKIVVAKELTKKFETIYRGKINEVIKKIEKNYIKGEFVVIIGK
jgi:16S rRNA (cytidine1402-2'-O)-methyltransferase